MYEMGGVDLPADALMVIIGGAGSYGVLASLFAITVLIGHRVRDAHLVARQHAGGRARRLRLRRLRPRGRALHRGRPGGQRPPGALAAPALPRLTLGVVSALSVAPAAALQSRSKTR